MPEVLIASDAQWVCNDVRSVLEASEFTVREVTRGAHVRPAVQEKSPDLVILDSQIGKMGGMATCSDLRLEEGGGRLPHVGVLLLLDRRADVFLARHCGADGWILKPLDPLRLSRAIRTVLAGSPYHDDAYRPPTIPVPTPAPGR